MWMVVLYRGRIFYSGKWGFQTIVLLSFSLYYYQGVCEVEEQRGVVVAKSAGGLLYPIEVYRFVVFAITCLLSLQ